MPEQQTLWLNPWLYPTSRLVKLDIRLILMILIHGTADTRDGEYPTTTQLGEFEQAALVISSLSELLRPRSCRTRAAFNTDTDRTPELLRSFQTRRIPFRKAGVNPHGDRDSF
jgi:hypothetical protein